MTLTNRKENVTGERGIWDLVILIQIIRCAMDKKRKTCRENHGGVRHEMTWISVIITI